LNSDDSIAKTCVVEDGGYLVPLLIVCNHSSHPQNHFILDAIVGAAVAGLSYALALLFAKLIKRS